MLLSNKKNEDITTYKLRFHKYLKVLTKVAVSTVNIKLDIYSQVTCSNATSEVTN